MVHPECRPEVIALAEVLRSDERAPAVIGGMQAVEVIKYIVGIGKQLANRVLMGLV
jgi:quinolinate synthase